MGKLKDGMDADGKEGKEGKYYWGSDERNQERTE